MTQILPQGLLPRWVCHLQHLVEMSWSTVDRTHYEHPQHEQDPNVNPGLRRVNNKLRVAGVSMTRSLGEDLCFQGINLPIEFHASAPHLRPCPQWTLRVHHELYTWPYICGATCCHLESFCYDVFFTLDCCYIPKLLLATVYYLLLLTTVNHCQPWLSTLNH